MVKNPNMFTINPEFKEEGNLSSHLVANEAC